MFSYLLFIIISDEIHAVFSLKSHMIFFFLFEYKIISKNTFWKFLLFIEVNVFDRSNWVRMNQMLPAEFSCDYVADLLRCKARPLIFISC